MKSINKFLGLLYCLLIFNNAAISQEQDDTILWGVKEITWADFKGEPDTNSIDEAHITYFMSREGNYITRDSLVYIVKALFKAKRSWTKTNSDYILGHERVHFDLTELYIRKIRKALSEKTFYERNLIKEIEVICNSIYEELSYKQIQYDKETEHSINKMQQAIWDKKICEELKQLEQYASVFVPLKVIWIKR